MKKLFTSESVTEGHPDKVCDRISDAILDEVLNEDPTGRVACETCITTGMVFITGEISTTAHLDIDRIARRTLRGIGYDSEESGFDANTCAIITSYNKIVVFIDRSPAECYNKFRMLWIGGTSPTAKTVFGRLQPQLLC